jgi:MinD-like ATPase involved in chromosome partitioning or flagellar assembly
MPGLTELTVVGDSGRVRVHLEDGQDLTVGDILIATAGECTGIDATAVEQAIDTGRLRLRDGDRELAAEQPADVIHNDSVTITLAPSRAAHPRALRAAQPPPPPEHPSWVSPPPTSTTTPTTSPTHTPTTSSELPFPPPDPSPADAPSSATCDVSPALAPPSHPVPADAHGEEPPAVALPPRVGAVGRLGTAYRALADGHPQLNGLPAPPPLTRAKQAWRHSRYLDTLTRGIAEPQLTQCAVLAFLSSKGGVGKTTTAKLVAMALAEARRDRCVLIDANPDRGTLGTSFARGHMLYVDDVRAAAQDPDLRSSDLDAMLATGPHGLRVLPAPQNSNRRRQLAEDDYTMVIDCLRRHVGIVVIDLGTDMLEGPTVAALKAAHQLIVVSNDDWIAGEQTAASFWDDVRAITGAEYTIVANDITGSHNAAARRLHGQLTGAGGADSNPRSVTVVAHNTTAYNKLQDRRVEWTDLPRQWQRCARELAYRLAQDWQRLALARDR